MVSEMGCGQKDEVWSEGWGVVREMGCGHRRHRRWCSQPSAPVTLDLALGCPHCNS